MASQWFTNIGLENISQQTKLAKKRNNKLKRNQPDVLINCSKSRIANQFTKKFAFVLQFLILLNVLTCSFFVDALTFDTVRFKDHHLIEPKIFHLIKKRHIENTHEKDGLHARHITINYDYNNKNVILDLQLNDNLLPLGHYLSYQHANGQKAIKNFTKTDVNLCHYHGKIRDNLYSSVAVSTCDGIRGVVFDGDETFYLEQEKNKFGLYEHFLIEHSKVKHDHKCGYKGGINRTHDPDLYDTSEFNRLLRLKRSSEDPLIRGPYNSNKHSSYVELVMVVDNKVFKAMDQNFTRVHQYCKDIANIINALYVPLNIFIALVGVVVWNEKNEVELSKDGDKTLKNFLHYRRLSLVKDHPNDNAQLLTREQFDGGVVGKALKGPICTYEFSGGVSMDHSVIIAIVATTIAHEMGHNFGMEHDTAECRCKDDKCIMAASSSSIVPTHWSSCSIDQLNLAFHHGMNYCLRNKPVKLFDSPVCGNGFVEAGEQCDCGLPQYCNNTCCNPYSCMLYTNASCATGACCDLKTCKPQTAGSMCREANGECDLPEFCTGESEFCPNDIFKRDTESCDRGEAFCYSGFCRSQNDQCKVLWGPSGNSSEQCYDKNTDGTRHGNCGYDLLKKEYITCNKPDVRCGMLHCRHLNERLEFGMESVALLAHSFINYKGSIIPCRTAIIDLGLQTIDPGLTPDGAKCGDGKMCVNRKCMSVESLRAAEPHFCDCNGHGVCNTKGNCHCDPGYAPPFCNSPGVGGSSDSGPAANPNEGGAFTRLMFIIFIGVIPCCSLFAYFIYYWHTQNHPIALRKAPSLPKHHIAQDSDNSQSPTFGPSSPNSPDDMNSSLLRPSDVDNNYIFGKFAGFTLKPLPTSGQAPQNVAGNNVALVHPVSKVANSNSDLHAVPSRVAPPPPNLSNSSGNKNQPRAKNEYTSVVIGPAPALPPLNPGSTARPIISNPILSGSTRNQVYQPCELSNKLPPIRTAPIVPLTFPEGKIFSNGYEEPIVDVLINPVSKEHKKNKESKLSRITSFLKKETKVELSNKCLNREKLKDIEISPPIPIMTMPKIDDENERKAALNRAQSMRDQQSVIKPTSSINSFGSMRSNRPKSIVNNVVASRPNFPPPRPPAPPSVTNLKIPGIVGYQNSSDLQTKPPSKLVNEYDDCNAQETSPQSPDNIYSVIDEGTPPNLLSPPLTSTSGSGSIESMGSISLLKEIVNEIECRNFDSIYIASTLGRNKLKNGSEKILNKETPDEQYSSTNVDSNASTTSSGYMKPSAINTPIARVNPSKSFTKMPSSSNTSLSSFRSAVTTPNEKPDIKIINFEGPIKTDSDNEIARYKTSTSNRPLKDDSTATQSSSSRPSLKNTAISSNSQKILKRSPSPKQQTSSIVKTTQKPKTPAKPSVDPLRANKKTPVAVPLKHNSSSNNKATQNKILNSAAKPKVSNVASLQQKFETTPEESSDMRNSKK